MSKIMNIGTRGSALALWQTEWVVDQLKERFPDYEFKIQTIKTTGDKMLRASFTQMVGKGFFTKEIEEALLKKEIDVAVHSLKDLPTEMPEGLILASVPEREEPNDVLISREKKTLKDLPQGARVGTCSPRREVQLKAVRPDLKIVPLRGNLNTRLKKVFHPRDEKEQIDATVLAFAGLSRMGLREQIAEIIPLELMLPAAGQGFLGIQTRSDDEEVLKMVQALECEKSRIEAEAERAFLAAWGGGCSVPVGVCAKVKQDQIEIEAVAFIEQNGSCVRDKVVCEKGNAVENAIHLAERIKTQ